MRLKFSSNIFVDEKNNLSLGVGLKVEAGTGLRTTGQKIAPVWKEKVLDAVSCAVHTIGSAVWAVELQMEQEQEQATKKEQNLNDIKDNDGRGIP